MTRDQALAIHGALVVRLVDRMMKFRLDRANAMFTSKLKEDDLPEGLTRYDEAVALIAVVHAAKWADLPIDYSIRDGVDTCSYERVFGLTEGHVLTASDMVDLEAVLAASNDEIGYQADKHHESRMGAFREIGGDDLVRAVEANDKRVIDAAVESAMVKFREMMKSREVAQPD